MRLLIALLPVALAVGCSGGSSAAPRPSVSDATSCDTVTTTSVPEACISDAPHASYPPSAAQIPALQTGPLPDDLGGTEVGRLTNDADPARTGGTLSVTVPAGARLGVYVTCQGNGRETVTTTPTSLVDQGNGCNSGTEPSEFATEDPTVQTSTRTYRLTLTTTGSVRWTAIAYSTTESVPATG